jgi:uncharacterized protein YciW
MSDSEGDVIDLLVGVEKGSYLDAIRAHRPEARENAQKSYLALFAPKFPGEMTREERYALAVFVAGLHRDVATLGFYRVSEADHEVLGERLSAALEHAHLLVFRPRDASPAALQALLDAGWSTSGIVTLSQLVAFLSFQIRVVVGLRALAATPSGNV